MSIVPEVHFKVGYSFIKENQPYCKHTLYDTVSTPVASKRKPALNGFSTKERPKHVG